MNYVQGERSGDRPGGRKFVNFPLVTMLLALGIAMLALAAGLVIAALVEPITGLNHSLSFDLVSVVLLLLAYNFIISRLGANPRNDYKDAKALRHFGLGLAAGLIIFSIAVGIAALLGVYHVIGHGDLGDLLPAIIGPALFAAVSEEMVFRGIFFRWIEEYGGSWLALIVTSALFGAAHLENPHSGVIAAVGIACEAGLMLSAAYMLTRSLWMPMGIHAAWNFAQGEIYDIPVSGTKVHGLVLAKLNGNPLLTGDGFGLEASLIAIVIATAFGLGLLWLAVRNGVLIAPSWARGQHRQQ